MVTLSNGAQWVDGVGSSIGDDHLLTVFMKPNQTGPGAWCIDRDEMIECRQNGKLIWTASDFTSIKEIESDSATSNALYDLQGRKVATAAPGRIYIKGGKKIVYH